MNVKRYVYATDCGVNEDPEGDLVSYEDWKRMSDYADELVKHKDMVCLPADLRNLRDANEHFAMENHRLHEELRQVKNTLRELRQLLAGEAPMELPKLTDGIGGSIGEPIQFILEGQNVGHSITNNFIMKKR